MLKLEKLPVVLTIAGSDSGGGAGVQADLKTFAALGVHGASAITCVTAQNPKRVIGIQACEPKLVRQQIEAVFAELHPAAVKTGMLYSAEIIRVVIDSLAGGKMKPERRPPGQARTFPPLIVDPVMISTSGSRLLKTSAIALLKKELLPLATLVTPNLDEAELLVGRKLKSAEDLRGAAKEIYKRFGCAALVKGGHLRNSTKAADIFFDGQNELLLTAPFIKGVRAHGTGCTFSAAITAFLALGLSLPDAVGSGKEYISQAVAQHQKADSHDVLNHFWQ